MAKKNNDEEYARMAAEAAELESKCATSKPERLPRHELALFLQDRKFPTRSVLIALGLVVVFVVLEFGFGLFF